MVINHEAARRMLDIWHSRTRRRGKRNYPKLSAYREITSREIGWYHPRKWIPIDSFW